MIRMRLSRVSDCASMDVPIQNPSGVVPVRLAAWITAALILVTFALGVPLVASGAPAVIGPEDSVVVDAELTQAVIDAALAKQKKTYDSQIATLRSQIRQLESDKSELESEITRLESQITQLKGGTSGQSEEIESLESLNESLREDYDELAAAQEWRIAEMGELTEKNRELSARVAQIRPPFTRDWLDWAALAVGVLVGGLFGLRVGIRRGEDRVTGGGIPASVAATWGEPEAAEEASEPA